MVVVSFLPRTISCFPRPFLLPLSPPLPSLMHLSCFLILRFFERSVCILCHRKLASLLHGLISFLPSPLSSLPSPIPLAAFIAFVSFHSSSSSFASCFSSTYSSSHRSQSLDSSSLPVSFISINDNSNRLSSNYQSQY